MTASDPEYIFYFPNKDAYDQHMDDSTYNAYSDNTPADIGAGSLLLLTKSGILTNVSGQLKDPGTPVDFTSPSSRNESTPNYDAFFILPPTFQWIEGGTEANPVLYNAGSAAPSGVDNTNILYLYPYLDVPCFKEDTKILTDKGYQQIKDLRKGDMVKTLKEGYRPVNAVGYTPFQNNPSHNRIKNQLYIYQKDKFPELKEDLVLTGSHSVLVKHLDGDKRKMVNEALGQIFVTEGHYRLPAYLDERAEIYETKGPFNVYHLCLDGEDPKSNHGIYANGLLAETCFIRELKTDRWTLL